MSVWVLCDAALCVRIILQATLGVWVDEVLLHTTLGVRVYETALLTVWIVESTLSVRVDLLLLGVRL